jgi:hypothetical protein
MAKSLTRKSRLLVLGLLFVNLLLNRAAEEPLKATSKLDILKQGASLTWANPIQGDVACFFDFDSYKCLLIGENRYPDESKPIDTLNDLDYWEVKPDARWFACSGGQIMFFASLQVIDHSTSLNDIEFNQWIADPEVPPTLVIKIL